MRGKGGVNALRPLYLYQPVCSIHPTDPANLGPISIGGMAETRYQPSTRHLGRWDDPKIETNEAEEQTASQVMALRGVPP